MEAITGFLQDELSLGGDFKLDKALSHRIDLHVEPKAGHRNEEVWTDLQPTTTPVCST